MTTDHVDANERRADAATSQCTSLQLEDALLVYDDENRTAWIKSTASCSVER